MHRSRHFLRVIFLALLAASSQFAQNQTATLVGSVLDAHGSAVPAAALEIRNTDTNIARKMQADDVGEFTVPNLPPGPYEVTVTKDGFRPLRETSIVLEVEQVARMDFRLEVGAVSQSVEVTAAAAPLINTENSAKGEVIMADEIVEMPLNGRAATDLALLVPSVVPNAQGAQGGPFAVNGARADNTNFILDGFNNQDPQTGGGPVVPPNLDALEEFKMETSSYSAEQGRLAGGVMNMVLKTGGNQVHGAVFEFLRNDMFDARNFFDQAKAKLRQNQFGGTVSGPVRIPKLYNGRDRTFFLFSWESFRQTQGQTHIGVVPTAAQRAGDYSGSAAIKDPLGGTFPGNLIPLSRQSPIALKAQQLYPLPNQAGVNNYLSYETAPSDWDRFIAKADERISDKDTVSFRVTRQHTNNIQPFYGSPNLGLFGQGPNTYVTLAGLSWTRMFRPNLINEARIGVTRNNQHNHNVDGNIDYNSQFGLPGPTDPRLFGSPSMVISGLDELGDGSNIPMQSESVNEQASDTLTWVKGHHLFKFGGSILRTGFNLPNWGNTRGTFNFTGSWTGQPYADFLLGELNSDTRTLTTTTNYLRSTTAGFFGQDDWKVSSRFTLNLGLRYEIPKPATEKYGQVTNFLPGTDKLVVGSAQRLPAGVIFANPNQILFADQAGLPQLAYTQYKDFAPRVGFAWRPFGGNRTSIRGGYGIFYGGEELNPLRNQLANTFPFVFTQTNNRNAAQPSFLTLASPYPVAPNLSGNISTLTVTGYELHAGTPYLQSWNLTVERDLGFSSALEISYAGSKGTHLPFFFNINQAFWPPQPAPNNVPYAGFGTINYFSFEVNSSYNAGTVTLRRRFTGGFFYAFNYQYSKTIDEGSEISGGSTGGINGLQDVRCLRCDRGRADWDIPHVFTMRFSWLSPFRRSLLTRGWQLASTGRMYTGAPFTLSVTNINIGLGQPNRPNRIAKGTVPDPNVNLWYDVAAFPQVPVGAYTFGDAGRNILDGPGHIETNFTLSRNFTLREQSNLQFRWEVFNATNHPNFNLPVTAVNAPNAATITAAGSSRLMQLGLRYQF